MNNRIIYTSIFGKFDEIQNQKLPENWDYKIFSEKTHATIYSDNNRNAKKFKILPHRYLSKYDYSIWLDGNMKVKENADLDILVDIYLKDVNIAFFSHSENMLDSNNCIYKEAEYIFKLGEKNMKISPERGIKNYKDDPKIIKAQMEKYEMLEYPHDNGLVTGMVILRRHNEPDVVDAMEQWWAEIKYFSKRDQLSFNFVAWNLGLKFNFIEDDSRNNNWFKNTGKHTGKK